MCSRILELYIIVYELKLLSILYASILSRVIAQNCTEPVSQNLETDFLQLASHPIHYEVNDTFEFYVSLCDALNIVANSLHILKSNYG